MKYQLLAALACCAAASLAQGANPPPKKAAAPSSKSAPQKPTQQRNAQNHGVQKGAIQKSVPKKVASTPGRTTASHNRYAAYRRPPVRHYSAQQMAPTADRYREIQDALAAQGYLKTPSTGVWDKDSIDAMQRFQKDKNLDPTGKLTAKSLSLLGLGPKPAAESPLLPANPTASLSAKPDSANPPVQ